MKGLIIKPYWADLILSGEKTWEIRGSWTGHRGPTAIIKSGTGKVFGFVDLWDCIPLTYHAWFGNKDKHRVEYGMIDYKRPHAWVMRKARKLQEPIPYNHPQGAVIWVNLPDITHKEDTNE